MTRILMAAAIVIAAMGLRPAQASEAPWCAIGSQSGTERCYYNSIEECVRARAGGFCNPNPRYHVVQQPGQKTRSVRRNTRRKRNWQ